MSIESSNWTYQIFISDFQKTDTCAFCTKFDISIGYFKTLCTLTTMTNFPGTIPGTPPICFEKVGPCCYETKIEVAEIFDFRFKVITYLNFSVALKKKTKQNKNRPIFHSIFVFVTYVTAVAVHSMKEERLLNEG